MDRQQVLAAREYDLSVANYGATRKLQYDVALLPWGATEPHNYHLPYLTDCILSHDIAVEAARKAFRAQGVRAMVMPPVTMGAQNPGQRELAFCVHARYETQRAILADIVSSLHHQGMRRLLIVNGHGGNSFKNMIRDLTIDFPDFTIASSEWFRMLPARDFFDEPGDHADELETSVMMHYHPELVSLDEAGEGKGGGFRVPALQDGSVWIPRDWSRVSTDTGIGSPRLATAEKGARFAAAVTDKYAAFLSDFAGGELY
ncbi:MAG: creatininase family protein [Prevotella sp.]|nr:creatininase family protein [Prevotella sp.]